ncbi:MAG: TIGR03435 family protein [Acidobacteriota bacterium]|nr:TIGR03435 family protein [Acidobacteriota bacterium]
MTQARPKYTHLASLFVFAIAASTPLALAQTAATAPTPAAAPAPAYDVMTIKPNNSASGGTDIDSDDGRFTATNVSLKLLLEEAYDIKQDLITGLSGPIESAHFDISAKISEPDQDALKKLTPQQQRKLLLPLLIERFQLKTHVETKVLPVYELVLLPGGPKFKPSTDQTEGNNGDTSVHGTRIHADLTAKAVPMSAFARSIAGFVHRTVLDKTGLKGNFDLTLQWSNDENPDSGAEQAPSIFTALQEQLGLKLQPAKGPVETLVVDHAAMPTDN